MIQVFVRKKPDRPYFQLYYVDPLTGTDRTKSTKTTDRKTAERAAERWENELQKSGENSGPTDWATFRRRFEDEHLVNAAPKTKKGYITALNRFEKLIGKPNDLRKIKTSTLSKYHGLLCELDLSKSSRANYIRHLRSALSWAQSLEMIAIVPRLRLPKGAMKSSARSRPVTETEFREMLAAVPLAIPRWHKEFTRVLWFIWYSGFRKEEAVKVSWDSGPIRIDLDGGQYPRFIFESDGQKSRNQETVPMAADCAAFLSLTPRERRQGRVFLVSPRKLGRRISAIGQAARVIVNDKGKHASAHDLRRSFATRWSYLVRPIILQRMMRHADIKTTLAFYVDQEADDVGAEIWRAQPAVPPNVPPAGQSGKKTSKPARKKAG